MKLIKLIPISEEAKAAIIAHGQIQEILLDNPERFVVRSLERTYKDQDGDSWKCVKVWTKEEATWEEVVCE